LEIGVPGGQTVGVGGVIGVTRTFPELMGRSKQNLVKIGTACERGTQIHI